MWATHEGQRHLEAMRETQRRQKAADAFYKNQLLSKCLRSWNIWVRAELLEKEMEKEKLETQRKMDAFLKACAMNDHESDVVNDDKDSQGKTSDVAKDSRRPPQPKKLQPWQITKKHVWDKEVSK